MGSGGSIEVTEIGEGTSIRPGSWNGAKAREGSSEDLRDPIRVHVRASRNERAAGTTKALAWKGPPTFRERHGEHETKEDRVDCGSEPISHRRYAGGKS